jgi:hypothetical protein
MSDDLDLIWLQVHLPHLKPIFVGLGFYRPTSAKSLYLDYNVCVKCWIMYVISIELMTGCQKEASSCNQCLQSGSSYQSTYLGIYKQNMN